jgi:glycosyltransferase involved in cell wall biosynthesis
MVHGLADRGHRVTCLVVGDAPTVRPNVRLEAFAPVEAPLPTRMWRALRAVKRLAPSFDLYNFHFAPYGIGVLGPGSPKVPVWCHFHGPWAGESTIEGEHRYRVAAKRRIERLVYHRATRFVTLSLAFKRLLVDEYGVEDERVHVVPPGVDADMFSPKRTRFEARLALGLPTDRPILFTLRRLVRRMGLEVLVESVRLLVEARPEVLLLIGGAGPLAGELEGRIRALGLAGNVRLLGFIADGQVPDYYRAADLFVLPSVSLEGFGLVTVESLASGTPVIGTPVGGVPEILEALDARLLTRGVDAESIAERLAEGIRDPSWLPGPDACRRFVEERYSWSASLAALEGLFEQSLSQSISSCGSAPRSPRVALFNPSGEISGAEVNLLQIAEAVVREGVEVRLLVPSAGELIDRARQLGLPVVPGRFLNPRLTANPLGMLRGAFEIGLDAWRLAGALRSMGAELVHANSIRGGLMASIGRPLHGLPTIWSIEDFPPAGPVGAIIRGIALVTGAHAISNSDAVRDDFAPWKALRRRTKTIHHALPASAFENGEDGDFRETWGISSSTFVAGYVGQIAPWKGIHDVIAAFGRVVQEGADARLVVVGAPKFRESNREYLRELEKLVLGLGLVDRVTFVGFQQDIGRVYRSLDVLVHASDREPFGRVLIEAMARRVPVIATAAGGVPEIVWHDRTGFLVRVGDVNQIAECLRILLVDPERRRRMGMEARNSVDRRFRLEPAVRQIATLYRMLIAGRQR